MKLKLYIGARVVFTTNINTSGHSVNGSTRKIEYMQMSRAGNNLVGIIYIKFDNVGSGNSLKLKVKYFKKWNGGMCNHHSYY